MGITAGTVLILIGTALIALGEALNKMSDKG